MDNIISIVGKTNVGKSTLFNFLIRKRKSIVNSKKNITKNRNYGFFYIKEKKFLLIDTGGFFFKKKNKIKNKIINNIFISIKESKLILFVVDIKYGLFNEDIKLSKILKKEKKNVFLIINKIDIKNTLFNYYDFYKLGFKKNYLISITHNIGFKKLYKDIYKFFKKKKKDKKKKKNNNNIKLTVVGVPNTGKSTFINKFFNDKNKSITSNISGTTTDTLYFYYKKKNINFTLIDTPGITKKLKFNKNIKKYYLLNTIKVIKESDISILIIDIKNKFSKNDLFILNKILLYKKGLLIIFNKCDLLKNNKLNIFKKQINKLNIYNNFPKLFISIKYNFNKKIFKKILNIINDINNNRKKKIKTSFLNKKFLFLIKKKKVIINNKVLKIKFCYQIKDKLFPCFVFICNIIKNIKNNFIKYIEKILIKKFNFYGTPIKILFKKNK